MKIRAPFCLLMIALPLALVAAEGTSTPTPTPTATPTATPEATPVPAGKFKAHATPTGSPKPLILKKLLRALGIQKTPTNTTATGFKGLEIGLKSDVPQVKIGETKQFKVTVTLINRGTKITQLDFPTSQRIEVLVKAPEGKTIEQWSEDQAFSNEPSLVTVNPGERLEYVVNLSTRDMVPNQTYAIEAFFPNFDKLRSSMTIATVPPVAAPPKAPTATPAATPAAATAPAAKVRPPTLGTRPETKP